MVKLNKIYTRTGDQGTSGLVDGSRRSKSDARFAACGAIDEANAVIGLAVCHNHKAQPLDSILNHIQNDLFDLGADLATPMKTKEQQDEALRIIDRQVSWLEREIDRINASLSPLKSFILPGGNIIASYLHLARTVVRRAERDIVALSLNEAINIQVLRYVNRLSDLLFVTARAANAGGKDDILWVPGQNRSI